ncbi:MAG: ferritin, partial [Bacteroidota bacterium]
MLSKKMQSALNQQIKRELYSAYLYLSMASHFEASNFPGFGHWMKKQYEEETGHGMKIYGYVQDRGGRVELEAIEKPPVKFKSPLEIMNQVLEHEKTVTGSIHALYELAMKENDYATQVMLQWFITEQVEEEKTVVDIIEQLKMVGDAPAGL